MPFVKGRSGNPSGRKKQTKEEKHQKEEFLKLLKSATVPALESIISIAKDSRDKNRLKACEYIIDKAYGNAALLLDDNDQQLKIEIVTHRVDEDWI